VRFWLKKRLKLMQKRWFVYFGFYHVPVEVFVLFIPRTVLSSVAAVLKPTYPPHVIRFNRCFFRVAQWSGGYGIGFATWWLRVRFPASVLSSSNLRQVVHIHLPLQVQQSGDSWLDCSVRGHRFESYRGKLLIQIWSQGAHPYCSA